MAGARQHHYQITNRWTGNLGTGTASYRGYSRDHELFAQDKSASIAGSSDPLYRGDRSRYNPEELLLGALSACHMLWVLHLCADAGIVVTEYEDHPEGDMQEDPDGSSRFTRVVLHPRMTITDAARVADATEVHERAHHFCAMAQSVNFPVECAPEIVAG
jgi:organic hydroperoxide reductase OsmC/OhrA